MECDSKNYSQGNDEEECIVQRIFRRVHEEERDSKNISQSTWVTSNSITSWALSLQNCGHNDIPTYISYVAQNHACSKLVTGERTRMETNILS